MYVAVRNWKYMCTYVYICVVGLIYNLFFISELCVFSLFICTFALIFYLVAIVLSVVKGTYFQVTLTNVLRCWIHQAGIQTVWMQWRSVAVAVSLLFTINLITDKSYLIMLFTMSLNTMITNKLYLILLFTMSLNTLITDKS